MFSFEDRTRALLEGVRRHGTLAQAARAVGLDPANARRHVRTAERRAGARLVVARRGGRDGRNARLTPHARRLLAARAGIVAHLVEHLPEEGVTLARVGRRVLFVAGRHPLGPAELRVPPESVAVERPGPGARTSVRNRIPMRVDAVRALDESRREVRLSAGALRLTSLVTRGAARDLALRVGARVDATIKAVAIEVVTSAGASER